MLHAAKPSRVGSGLSVADILGVLYWAKPAIDPSNARRSQPDRLTAHQFAEPPRVRSLSLAPLASGEAGSQQDLKRGRGLTFETSLA